MATIHLIDGNNYVHRGWHALTPMKNKEGFPTHGIKGTLNIIMADLRRIECDRTIVVFDKGGKPNWRSELYPEYKKSPARVKGKDDNKEVFTQFKPIRKLLKAMGIRVFGKAGVEADDLIGTLAVMFEAMGHTVLISSKDKDFASLVTKNIRLLQATTRKEMGPIGVKNAFGVKPSQMVEYLMLLGDKVDNIPGIPKCGPGTAKKWLNEYGDIKTLLKNTKDLTPVIKANLKAGKGVFKWTRTLIDIKIDIPHKITFENCAYQEPDMEKLKKLCMKYELKATHDEIKQVLKTLKVGAQESKWKTKTK